MPDDKKRGLQRPLCSSWRTVCVILADHTHLSRPFLQECIFFTALSNNTRIIYDHHIKIKFRLTCQMLFAKYISFSMKNVPTIIQKKQETYTAPAVQKAFELLKAVAESRSETTLSSAISGWTLN
jgi:hypothetical protein